LLVPDLAARRFRIEGHTDSSGSRAANIELSKRRAQAVADLVSSLGVQPARLEVRGYGPDRPLPGHAASSPDNRRVEARLL
jgi:outer membrane protein OmpA-like peptidoglycan-associated protein